ncbi:maleylacetoacetate isomerase [Paraburkholderia phymatum]|uniref:Maleylacetoacetate isomerase n=1 Tax=Paraburkholderia phymatum (strain DSM 17167 / CIP 108236 / LMG 21445 / STM815) TaxID=391038 RepID=B2JCD6_PARP8|nr:maleylacetoacetate isomerase [Paraburkholderia phymatum]ACC69500.1 maleylacetoacetate isomerase [Paraburkholderia phymatum STM815]
MKLYSYFRSSASYRVRIALNLKNLPYEYVPVHLLRDGGEQFKPEYRKLNHDAIVPTLVDNGHVITQSLAIIEYLEETHPEPALLPSKPADRAYVRSIVQQLACEIHPLNNLRVLKYLKRTVGVSDEVKDAWYHHWISSGFAALEEYLVADGRAGMLCFGDTPTIADICLVPQVFNASRFNVDLSPYPTIRRICDYANSLDAFARAEPSVQPDAE